MEVNNNNKDEYKYICVNCDYKCKFDCEWKKHCETTLHKTGKRKKKIIINNQKNVNFVII